MTSKPTYEELKNRVKLLESEAKLHSPAAKTLKERDEQLEILFEYAPDVYFLCKLDGTLLDANKTAEKVSGYDREDVIGKSLLKIDILPSNQIQKATDFLAKSALGLSAGPGDFTLIKKDGDLIEVEVRTYPAKIRDASVVLCIARDITERKKAEAALREKEKKLAHQAEHLEEVNTALKVLLEHREEERKQSEENIMINLKKLILPYIEKMENTMLNDKNATYLSIIKSNLTQMVSPFANRLSSKFFELTPSEIQIADLIKHGKTSKEVASLLNVSPKAISFHRGNIRKKLGLANKKINLRSYLQSFLSADPL